jgi:hypothetical protein
VIINALRQSNPWWITGQIDEEFDRLKRRLYYPPFQFFIKDTTVRRAVVLMGMRRIGKSVIMQHAVNGLLAEGVPKNKICFINVDNPVFLNMVNFGLDQLFKLSMEAVGSNDPAGWYVFYDEIQYLPDWERHLKVMVDTYPKTKFIASGSAGAALKKKSQESGAGRFTEFVLPPLTFHEYIHLTGYDHLIVDGSIVISGHDVEWSTVTDITAFNTLFVEYINYGGYPELLLADKTRINVARYIGSDIIDKVLLRDLPSLYGIRNVQELNAFFTMLVYQTGNELSYTSLSQSSQVDVITLKKYLDYLEAAFLIKRVSRVGTTGKKFSRERVFKIYITNSTLRTALFGPMKEADDMMGHLVETAVFAQWLHRGSNTPLYARDSKGEVDMVVLNQKKSKPRWAIEVKWKNKPFEHVEELKNVVSFCRKSNLPEAIVTTYDLSGTKNVHGIEMQFVPSSVYAFNVGARTIQHRYIDVL